MNKIIIYTCLALVLLVSCENKESEKHQNQITDFINHTSRLDSLLDNIKDTIASDALVKIKSIEDSLNSSSKKFALNLLNSKQDMEKIKESLNKAIETKISLNKKLVEKRYETQLKSLAKAKYHIDKAGEAVAQMKTSPYSGFEELQQETRQEYEQLKKDYDSKIFEYEQEKSKSLDKIKKEESLMNDPLKLLKLWTEDDKSV